MIDEHLWQIYCQAYFQPCAFNNDSKSTFIRDEKLRNSAIISLWNPRGAKFTGKKNRQLSRLAMERLKSQGKAYALLWGGDRKMAYKELSVLLPCTCAQAMFYANRYQQLAFYYIDSALRLWLVDSCGTRKRQLVHYYARTRFLFSGLPVRNAALAK